MDVGVNVDVGLGLQRVGDGLSLGKGLMGGDKLVVRLRSTTSELDLTGAESGSHDRRSEGKNAGLDSHDRNQTENRRETSKTLGGVAQRSRPWKGLLLELRDDARDEGQEVGMAAITSCLYSF